MSKTVLVTGGNRGLGYELGKLVLLKGDQLILTSRDPAAGQAAAKSLEEATGKAPLAVLQFDAEQEDSGRNLAQAVVDGGYKVDALVLNAGYLQRNGWGEDVWKKTLTTNVYSAINTTLAMAEYMPEGGRVVLVSSGLGKLMNSSPHYVVAITQAQTLDELRAIAYKDDDEALKNHPYTTGIYNVSKAMLNRAMLIMANLPVLADKRITVLSADPGWCRTDMGSQDAPRSAEQGAQSILWCVDAPAEANCSFTFDGKPNLW